MKKLLIKNIHNETLQTAIFENQNSIDDFLEVLANSHAWGSPEEYFVEVLDVTAEVEQQRINDEALAYLVSTDYMLLRELDGGIAMSAEVKLARAEARARIVR